MRAMVLAIAMVTVVATGLEAQATASPSSRVAPKAPARGIRTEPPPPDPSQPAPPAGAPSAPPAGTGTTIINNNYYTYGVGQPLAYTATEATYAQLAPPPAPIDVRGPQPAPATAYVPGHWVWTGSSYNWNEGRWVAIPAGYTRWVPGHWAQNQFGWYFLRGYWEP